MCPEDSSCKNGYLSVTRIGPQTNYVRAEFSDWGVLGSWVLTKTYFSIWYILT